jgi:transcriptional/translational regulatory protein YebC/TACO1
MIGKYGGNLGAPGCVAWMFKKRGVIEVPSAGLEEDKVMEVALEAGADDLETVDEYFTVYTDQGQMEPVRKALEEAGIKVESSKVQNIPDNSIKIDNVEDARKLLKLIEMLEEHDDVSAVSANFEFDDAVSAQLDA